jgi:hypothetical protein
LLAISATVEEIWQWSPLLAIFSKLRQMPAIILILNTDFQFFKIVLSWLKVIVFINKK